MSTETRFSVLFMTTLRRVEKDRARVGAHQLAEAIALAGAVASFARWRRVFAVRKVSTPVHLHADEIGIGASHARGNCTQEYGNV